MKTGFPVELEILSFLNSRNWFPTPHEYYFDYDENKAREIDIRASRYRRKSAPNFNLLTFLAIECKKSETDAWIFFSTKLRGHFVCQGQYADYLRSQNVSKSFSLILHLLSHLPHYRRSTLLAIAYTQVKLRKKSGRDGKLKDKAFEAINQVTKYVSYEIKSYLDAYRKERFEPNSCVFFFPIIVFDGKLYKVRQMSGAMSLRRTKHVVLTAFYRSRYSVRRDPFYIDIVTRKYFPTYLSIIEKEIDSLNKKIGKIKNINEKFVNELRRIRSGSEKIH